MRSVFFSVVLGGTLMLQAWQGIAQTETDPDITGVIDSQIEAFKSDDFATAFTFASPTIQGIFGSPEVFGSMVKNGYPMVWRPAEVTYGVATERGGRVLQTVRIVDMQGALHLFEYEMVEVGGVWRINGVRPLEAPSVGA